MMKRKLPRGVFVGKDGLYWIRYADGGGKIRREKVGPYVTQAGAAYQKRKSEVREGKFFPEKIHRRSLLFEEMAKDFLLHSRQTKRSHGHDAGRMETLLKLWRDCLVVELSAGRIERDLAECAEKEEWAPATYNRYRALVSGIFSLAIRNGKANANPVRGTKHRIENNARVRYLTDDEEKSLMEQVRATCPELEPQILVALHSGMRRSEQYVTRDCPDGGLKWQHVDFRSGVITLPRSKHGEIRHIRMNSLLKETLKGLRLTTNSTYVFPVEPPDKLFPEICSQAEMADFTWHCLRHTFASRLVMGGVDIRTVQELMGHRSIVTTMRYAHLAPRHQADAVERLVRSPVTATDTATRTTQSAGALPAVGDAA
ncbi:MAG TPA: site-specific integrase [Terriglobia bacterium]|jgi:integrase|nr:site-specific integrase [Terriglobia bacterium]